MLNSTMCRVIRAVEQAIAASDQMATKSTRPWADGQIKRFRRRLHSGVACGAV